MIDRKPNRRQLERVMCHLVDAEPQLQTASEEMGLPSFDHALSEVIDVLGWIVDAEERKIGKKEKP